MAADPLSNLNRSGRKPGVPNKRTLEGEAFARAWVDQHAASILNAVLASDDNDAKLNALKFLFEQAFGKAKLRADVNVNAIAGIVLKWGPTVDGDAPAPDKTPDGDRSE